MAPNRYGLGGVSLGRCLRRGRPLPSVAGLFGGSNPEEQQQNVVCFCGVFTLSPIPDPRTTQHSSALTGVPRVFLWIYPRSA